MTVVTVTVRDFEFVSADGTHELTVAPNTEVTFDFQGSGHTVMTKAGDAINADPININNGNGEHDAVPQGEKRVVTIKGDNGGEIRYQCGIHGTFMNGVIHIS
jgi:plastocyanin